MITWGFPPPHFPKNTHRKEPQGCNRPDPHVCGESNKCTLKPPVGVVVGESGKPPENLNNIRKPSLHAIYKTNLVTENIA